MPCRKIWQVKNVLRIGKAKKCVSYTRTHAHVKMDADRLYRAARTCIQHLRLFDLKRVPLWKLPLPGVVSCDLNPEMQIESENTLPTDEYLENGVMAVYPFNPDAGHNGQVKIVSGCVSSASMSLSLRCLLPP
jgi:hypothetical protein